MTYAGPIINLFAVKPNKDSIVVDSVNLLTGVVVRNLPIIRNSNYWHAFLIHNNNDHLKRNSLLKIVLDHVYPLDLIPVHYNAKGTDAMFLARNCTEVIEKICKDHLIIPNPHNPKCPFKLEIILRFSQQQQIKIDAQKNILTVLNMRYSQDTKVLNLEEFHQDPALNEYSPLFQPKIFYFVLHTAHSSGMNFVKVKLNNNYIRSLFPLEAVWGTNITSLDLRNNLLDNISQLETLKLLKLTELYLDGNPLCNNYDEYSYVQRIKDILPKLERLDGVILTRSGIPASRQNFFCDDVGFDFVDQFLEYYFPIYDSRRLLLEGLYHKNAMFSLTAHYKSGQNSSIGAQLRTYQTQARNLKLLADFSRSSECLFIGNFNIIKRLNQLPPTEHDPYSFTTDLIYHTDSGVAVSITGVFKERPENLLDTERLLGFNRTFFLEKANNEYCITNEMLHVYNALNPQELKAFVVSKPPPQNLGMPAVKTPRDRIKANEGLQLITGLTAEWSKKLLEDAQYDLKRAVAVFVDLYKVDKIPVDAFKSQEEAGYATPEMAPSIDTVPEKSKSQLTPAQKALGEKLAANPASETWSDEIVLAANHLFRPAQIKPEVRCRVMVIGANGAGKWVILPPVPVKSNLTTVKIGNTPKAPSAPSISPAALSKALVNSKGAIASKAPVGSKPSVSSWKTHAPLKPPSSKPVSNNRRMLASPIDPDRGSNRVLEHPTDPTKSRREHFWDNFQAWIKLPIAEWPQFIVDHVLRIRPRNVLPGAQYSKRVRFSDLTRRNVRVTNYSDRLRFL